MVHRVTDHERAPLGLAGPIFGIGIDLPGRLLNDPAHAIDVPGDVGNLFFSLAPKGGQFALTLLSIAATVIVWPRVRMST